MLFLAAEDAFSLDRGLLMGDPNFIYFRSLKGVAYAGARGALLTGANTILFYVANIHTSCIINHAI
jgi:hypothetical protein